MSTDIFEDIQSQLKMIENPLILSQYHIIGLLHFSADAADILHQMNCDGNHALWKKFATHSVVRKVVATHCRHQASVCASLLALPHNPLASTVLESFSDDSGAFALVRIFKSLVEQNAGTQILSDVVEKVWEIAKQLPLKSQQDLALRVMETCHGSPMLHPKLLVDSYNMVRQLKPPLMNNFESEFITQTAANLGRIALDHPVDAAHAGQYYIQHWGSSFESQFYTTVLHSLGWNSTIDPNSMPAVSELVAVLNQQPGFETWLTTALETDDHYTTLKQHFANERQKLVLTAVTSGSNIIKHKKM